MKHIFTFFIISIVFYIANVLFSVSQIAFAQETTLLAQEDIVALTKPSVVRIAQHVKGTVSIPALTINLKDWSVAVDASRPSKIVPVDETLSGSGFIVSSDGYIVTNSHVVSLVTTKIDVMTSAVLPTMYESALALNEEEANKVFQNEDATFAFSKKVFEYVSDHSVFDVKQDIVVFDPSSDKEKFDDLMAEGFPVRVVSVNDRFYDDNKDVALIKIDQQNLPVVPLGNTQSLYVGKQVSILGFPATAEFNQRNPLESTFTRGVISALKDSEKKDFKVFQTDAKVSEGSSGGPLVDENGTIAGIITFQTNQLQKISGDSFAFAIPVDLVNAMIKEAHIDIKPSSYQQYFRQGLERLHIKHCISASDSFDLAKKSTEVFDVSRYVDPYIAYCQTLVASGQSIDTFQNKTKDFMERVSSSMWLAIGIGGLFGFSLGFIIWWLIREVNKEEKEIHRLEQRLHEEEKREYKNHQMIEKLSKK